MRKTAATALLLALAHYPLHEELPKPTQLLDSWVFKPKVLSVPVAPPEHVVATAYCGCPLCCGKWSDGLTASGAPAEQGITLATDWKVFPKGLCLSFPKLGARKVQDTGRLIKGNKVDVYFDDHEEAKSFGVKVLEVKPC